MLLKAAIATLPYFALGQSGAPAYFGKTNLADHSNLREPGVTVDLLKVYCEDDSDQIACNDEYLPVAESCIEEAKANEDSYTGAQFKSCLDDGIAGLDPDALDPEVIYAETFGDIDQGNDPLLSQMLLELNNLQMVYEKYQSILNSEGEPDFAGVRALGGGVTDRASAQAASDNALDQMNSAKRFIELKQLVAFMQPYDKRISRFCFYGCWCLPEGAHSFVAGEGRAVDLSDKACQYLWFCYTCAKQEFRGTFQGQYKECTPDKQKYKFNLKMDKDKPGKYELRTIRCGDHWYHPMDSKAKWRSNCAKAICECDRGLAFRLFRALMSWDKSRHRIWSKKVTSCQQLNDCLAMPSTNPEETELRNACIKRGCLFTVKHRCLKSDTDGYAVDHAQICCGRYEDDGGRWEMRDHGGTHACCDWDEGTGYKKGYPWAGAWYNVITNCCPNGNVLSASDPNC